MYCRCFKQAAFLLYQVYKVIFQILKILQCHKYVLELNLPTFDTLVYNREYML